MAYVINKFSGEELIVLEDGTVNTTTGLGLVGKNYTGYGEIQNENFVFLLENFSNVFPPSSPLEGQIWHDATLNTLKFYSNNAWVRVGSSEVGDLPPSEVNGTLWFDTTSNQLKVFDEAWKLIGPESIAGFGETKAKSMALIDSLGDNRAVIEVNVDGITLAIISSEEFIINSSSPILGFNRIKPGINISDSLSLGEKIFKIYGDLTGVASSALRFENPRTINGVLFDGQNDITITSNTAGKLKKGSYILGDEFNGSRDVTWNINGSSSNVIGTLVARDSAGNFSAGIISADIIGNVTGNVISTSGTSAFDTVTANNFIGANLSGNASTASKLEQSRLINGVPFNGSANITVTAESSTLTGTVLSSTVKNSSLESTGILTNLKIKDAGLVVGDSNGLKLYVESGTENAVVSSQTANKELEVSVKDASQPGEKSKFRFLPSNVALNLGGTNNPAFVPGTTDSISIGTSTIRWKNVYANIFYGTATSAQYADLAENYSADAEYDPGTVVMFGGDREITIAEEDTSKIAGVISENPAYLMNSTLSADYVATLALQGRVKCKIIGEVKKGDMLISAGGGYAKACENPKIGQVIGKSLEDSDGLSGIIEVVVGRL